MNDEQRKAMFAKYSNVGQNLTSEAREKMLEDMLESKGEKIHYSFPNPKDHGAMSLKFDDNWKGARFADVVRKKYPFDFVGIHDDGKHIALRKNLNENEVKSFIKEATAI